MLGRNVGTLIIGRDLVDDIKVLAEGVLQNES